MCIIDGDTIKAYDHASLVTFTRNATYMGMPQILIAAWVREVRRMYSIFVLDQNRKTAPVKPQLFNLTLDPLIMEFTHWCQARNFGVEVDGFSLPILVFADNFLDFLSQPGNGAGDVQGVDSYLGSGRLAGQDRGLQVVHHNGRLNCGASPDSRRCWNVVPIFDERHWF